MTRLPPLQMPGPEPDKPLAEMTAEERVAYLRKLRRWIRDNEVYRGARAPRTMREIELRRQGAAAREAMRAERIARAERRVERRRARAADAPV
jgi:hypothetical protein